MLGGKFWAVLIRAPRRGVRKKWRAVAPSGSVSLLQELSPPFLEELPHVVSGAADVRVVLVELFAVIEYQVDVDDERLEVLVPKRKENKQKCKN